MNNNAILKEIWITYQKPCLICNKPITAKKGTVKDGICYKCRVD